MSERDDLRKLINDLAVVRGRVVLSSGAEADFYVDLRRLTLHHAGAALVGQVMLDLVEDWSFDSVGGLLAKYLGKVPIPGSSVEVKGLRLMAEEAKGRRNRVGTVLIAPVTRPESWPPPPDATGEAERSALSRRAHS